MGRLTWFLGGVVLALVALGIAGVVYVRASGLDAAAQPSPLETRLARAVRPLAIPAEIKAHRDPVSSTPAVVEEARAHVADHCAGCHANDGSGNTEQGRGLYPKAPDMRLPATQSMSDLPLMAGQLNSITRVFGVVLIGRPPTPAGHVWAASGVAI